MSFLEALANVLVGYGLGIGIQIIVFPVFGLAVTFRQNLAIGLVFTIVSIVRSFALRRMFEAVRTRGQ